MKIINRVIFNSLFPVLLYLVANTSLKAQPAEGETGRDSLSYKRVSVGVNLLDYYGGDMLGMGGSITSPFWDGFALRATGGIHSVETILPGGTNTTFCPFYSIQLGLVMRHFAISPKVACYVEAGAVVIFPNSNITTKSNTEGEYILIGEEIYVTHNKTFFLEAGGVNGQVREDKLPSEPYYAAGLLISTGLRIHL